VGAQAPTQELDELGVPPPPPILDVEIDDRTLDVGKADPDDRPMLVLALVQHEHPVRPQEQLPGQRYGGERRHPRRADLVSRVLRVEILRGAATVDVGRTDEQDALASRGGLPEPIVRRAGGTLTPVLRSG
jgi:hypothetical protein